MPEDFTPGADDSGSSFDEFLARSLAGERTRAERSIDLSRFHGARTQELLQRAGRFALERGQRELDALHVLRVLVEEPPARDAVEHIGADPRAILRATEERLPAASAPADVDGAVITASVQRALFHAFQVARSSGSTYVDPEHLFFALVLAQDTPAGQVLARAGVTAEALTQGLRETVAPSAAPAAEEGTDAAASATPMLDTYGTDLTARALEGGLDPVIGRADEIEQTIEILSRRTKNNPVLVGEAGVGKTAIVEGLAQAIVDGAVPEQLLGKRVIALDLPAMLAGTRYRGDFEERLTKTMDEIAAHKGELVIFVDEVHTVVGAGGAGDGGMDAGNILKPRLARGDLHLVGATTLKEYRVIEKDPALERRFQPVRVGEPSVADAVLILQGLKPAYEEHHGIVYTDDALRAAVELSDRYLSDRVLPDKAIDLIDQAGARLRLRLGAKVDVSGLIEQLATLEADKTAAVSAEHYEEASRVRDRIAAVQARLDDVTAAGAAARGEAVVDEPEIAAVISRATGIPVNRLTETERERLAQLEDELHDRVIGQDDAVAAVAKAVRRNPYSIVLFDEIEKAHPDVFNLLLQVLDDGRLTDGQGRTVDFRNTVVVMTSNLGSEFLASRGGAIGFLADGGGATGFGSEKDLRDRVFGKLREAMRPEFLNRIDEIVLFRKLEKPQLQRIVRLLLAASDARVAKREVSLVVTDSAVAWLADNGYEPEYGARPLRRLIQREVDDRIADLFVTGALVDGGTVTVDAAADELTVVAGSSLAVAA